jgi:hypothetical protein
VAECYADRTRALALHTEPQVCSSDPQGGRHRRPWLRFMALLSAHALSLLGFGGLMERQGRTSLLCADRCEKVAALLNVATEMPQRRTTIHAAQQETRNGLQWQG